MTFKSCEIVSFLGKIEGKTYEFAATIFIAVVSPVTFTSRDQLRNFRSSLYDLPGAISTPPPLTSTTIGNDRLQHFFTDQRLAQQKDWLKKFQQDISFGPTFAKAPGSDADSVYPFSSYLLYG